MIADDAWERLMREASLFPDDKKEEHRDKIAAWKRIAAHPLPSVRARGFLETFKRWRGERSK